MGRWPNLCVVWFAALIGLGATGCPNQAIGPGPRTVDTRRTPPRQAESPDAAAAKRALETLCDRMEDCAIERNVALAKAFGGNRADLEAARLQARIALHSGYVRRWCQLRLGQLPPRRILQIHKCLARTACGPFYQCADRSRRPPRPFVPSARLPK